MKNTKSKLVIDKATAQVLRNKIVAFEKLAPRKNIFLTMVTTFGVKDNEEVGTEGVNLNDCEEVEFVIKKGEKSELNTCTMDEGSKWILEYI